MRDPRCVRGTALKRKAKHCSSNIATEPECILIAATSCSIMPLDVNPFVVYRMELRSVASLTV